MKILPVIDLMKGVVVRGFQGVRSHYKPLVTKLAFSNHPVDVANAFRERFGFDTLYLADLDAIGGAEPAYATLAQLGKLGFQVWVDAGVREASQAGSLLAAGVQCVVAGLETLSGPHTLADCLAAHNKRIVFSLDLRAGQPLGATKAWSSSDAFAIAAQAIELGVHDMIVLDLTRIGCRGGTGTDTLCRRILLAYPHVRLYAGGGVRAWCDVENYQKLGMAGVLIASALHDSRITRDEIERLG